MKVDLDIYRPLGVMLVGITFIFITVPCFLLFSAWGYSFLGALLGSVGVYTLFNLINWAVGRLYPSLPIKE